MSRFLKISDKQLEFPEEIKEVLYFNNLVVVLYRKDREIPNNVIISEQRNISRYSRRRKAMCVWNNTCKSRGRPI